MRQMKEKPDTLVRSPQPDTGGDDPVAVSPTLSKRRLSKRLRELREAKRMTADAVVERAHGLGGTRWSASKITRLERDEWLRPRVEDVELLLDVYDVTDLAERAELVRLAREARQRGWWAAYDDVLGRGALTGLEPGASRIRTVELTVIPGLLQTPDYARAVIQAGGIHDDAEVNRRVEARMLRQRILAGPDTPQLWAIIDVAALRKADTAQLRHLIDVQRRDLRVRVLPDEVGPHAAVSGGFTLLDFDGDSTVVYTENPVTQALTDDPDRVREWELVYQYVSASALSVEESRTLIQDLIDRQ